MKYKFIFLITAILSFGLCSCSDDSTGEAGRLDVSPITIGVGEEINLAKRGGKTYSTTNPDVADVTANGKLIGRKVGKALVCIDSFWFPVTVVADATGKTEVKNSAKYSNDQVIGNWKIVGIKTSEDDVYMPAEEMESGFIFNKENARCVIYNEGQTAVEATWRLHGNNITCYSESKVYVVLEIQSLSDNECEIKVYFPQSQEIFWQKCVRISK